MDATVVRPSHASASGPALGALADLLRYPGPGYAERARAAGEVVGAAAPGAAEPLARYLAWVAATEPSAQEESYTRTFDWSPTHCLELGWHLHGETYDRGAFLVTMREVLRRAGLEEEGDLPDHLRLVLGAVARLPEPETAPLVSSSLVPALAKILAGFGTEANPYADLLRATSLAVRALHPAAREGDPR